MMNQKRFTRFAAIALSLTFLTSSILSGCEKKEETTKTPNTKQESSTVKDGDKNNTTSETTEAQPLIGDFTTMTYTGEPVDQSIFSEADLTMINVYWNWLTY